MCIYIPYLIESSWRERIRYYSFLSFKHKIILYTIQSLIRWKMLDLEVRRWVGKMLADN